ncbi:META domain-containing protein [Devosia faecipullorum]|uniref:META domain-containing protein n=1 Tax=Devosia faecipullorum TaxID=2755039 RepID=UPI00187B1B61|nr:META domain-containing protein [Devosia faecipullorum]MBE7732469.1 META domain-containing protein [Devosia faecipullorum]
MSFLRLVGIIFACLFVTAPALAQGITLSGTVTYRERIALPPDAQLRISLVSLPGGAPVAGASADIPAKGQIPLAFSLNVHRQPAAGAYGLVAEIRSGENLLFRNAQPVPLQPDLTHRVEIMVQKMPRSPTPVPPPLPALTDIVWNVTSIGGRPAIGPRPPTLSIAADLRASGHGGCNNYFAETSLSETELTFGPAAATRMACEPDLMAQESAYFAALAAVTGFELEGRSLRLLDAAGIPLIGLVRSAD